MKKALFIDRDGTLIIEPPTDYQVDSLEKLEFYPGVFRYLGQIAREFDYELVMVTNQDGLGTDSFPEETFWPAHNKMLQALENEGIVFSEILIDRSFPADNLPTRKPGIGLLTHYLQGDYNLANCFVIGDRLTDVQLAQNLGSRAIYMGKEVEGSAAELNTESWQAIYEHLRDLALRQAEVHRRTRETDIHLRLQLDGTGQHKLQTGLGFLDHMLEQICRHGGLDLELSVQGDLHIDEHHSIEDAALALGQAFRQALGDKRGIQRYGHFLLPMDDCLAQVALDFGGRPWLVWQVEFKRERLGGVPTEMFYHFFKSFSDQAACNLNIKAEGQNDHHKIEAIFKAFAKAIRMAIQATGSREIPSSKGVL